MIDAVSMPGLWSISSWVKLNPPQIIDISKVYFPDIV